MEVQEDDMEVQEEAVFVGTAEKLLKNHDLVGL